MIDTEDKYTLPDDLFSRSEKEFAVGGDADMFIMGFSDNRYPDAETYICCTSLDPNEMFVLMSFDDWKVVEDYRILYEEKQDKELAGLIKRLASEYFSEAEEKKSLGEENENESEKFSF